ncbi:gamma-secretase subunit Aph-1 [Tieghemostelium lacteum]|uniref:Gamma-secretase subunit Aph-1 n=1 Tax=Tieghemostelium lacteum TaxID=361077 RepID=A0A151ZDP5_TIELA|nr:gamma-secretase subunit Aph-1 [Tieghemostelium lacteum]|eukprot:KYQ92067.1 gamma-secretase subunit Aph-1 [Tieghemostelium lacteum]
MTQVLFFGCLFVAFSPAIAFFFFVIARNSQLILLSIGGSFFWLLSILLASIWWYIIPPMRSSYWFIIPFSIAFQELFRYIFYRLYSWGFNNRPSLSQIQQLHQEQLRLQFIRDQQEKDNNQKLPKDENKELRHEQSLEYEKDNSSLSSSSISNQSSSVNNTDQSSSSSSKKKPDGDEDKDISESVTDINARLETLSARPNHTLSSAAIGTGSGLTYGFVMFGSILWDATGPGTLFSPACPSTNLFMVSAILTMCIILLHICNSVLAFQGYRSKQYHIVAFVLLTHFIVSYLTLLNQPERNCVGSLVPIIFITIISIIYTFYNLLRSDSITKID